MAQEQPKLSYVGTQFRVKLEFNRSMCMDNPQPSSDLPKRARAKMDSIKQDGHIVHYELYYEKLKDMWKKVAEDDRIAKDRVFHFVLAAGYPPLKGLTVEPVNGDKSLASITISSSMQIVKQWRPEWLILYIAKALKDAGIKEPFNCAQVVGAWLKASSGEKVEKLAISAKPPLGSEADIAEKPYSIMANKNRKEIALVVRDVNLVTSGMSVTDILKVVKDAAAKVASQFGGEYHTLKKEVQASLANAACGPESVGMDLPLMILGACGISQRTNQTTESPDYPGAGRLKIAVEDDNLTAHIADFDMTIYEDESFKKSTEWVKAELKRYGIVEKAYRGQLKTILVALEKRENLDGLCIAEGRPSIGGSGARLRAVFQDTAKDHVESDSKSDLRSLQQRSIARAGQLVAKVAYKSPPEIGWDIFGNDADPEENEQLSVTVGDGIRKRGESKFFASFDGVPVVDSDKNMVSVSKILVHSGDVNLRSGNIIFDGPAEITGSIDSGATVEVSGDLTIQGSIRGGIIRTGGNFKVKNGIVTGKGGLISAKGNVEAEFVENSNIECGGNIIVKKAIINSEIICGGSINVTDQTKGVLAGGSIACRNKIYTANLAFKNGAATVLNVGVDWTIERKVRIRRKRLDQLTKTQADDRQALRELTGRKNQERNVKVQEKKDHYQKRLQKERGLLEMAKKRLEEAQAELNYNPKSKIFVFHTAHANVEIEIGGGPATIAEDMAGIAVLAKRKHGSKVVPIEVGQKIEEDERD